MEEQNTADIERQRSYEQLGKLRPVDDIFFREIIRGNRELAQFVLRTITGISDLVITEDHTQYDLHRLLGARSLQLDFLGKDSLNRRYNLEMEKSPERADPHRARYNSSSMDVEFLNAGDEFTDLPISYVIFVTETDVFKEGKLLYFIERINTTTGKPFNDDEHIIYMNSAYDNAEDDSDLAKLAHDFLCSNADDMYLDIMAERTRYFKTNPKGVEQMCKIMEDRVNETAKRAKHEQAVDTAIKMIIKGLLSLEDIAEYNSLPLDEVKTLAEKHKPATA